MIILLLPLLSVSVNNEKYGWFWKHSATHNHVYIHPSKLVNLLKMYYTAPQLHDDFLGPGGAVVNETVL